MRASFHALDRYREHHPESEGSDLLLAAKWGETIPPELVQALCGRRNLDLTSNYIVTPDKKGIFVVNVEAGLIITYLRLGDAQMKILAPASVPAEAPIVEEPPVEEAGPLVLSRKERLLLKAKERYEAKMLAEQEARYADWIPAMKASKGGAQDDTVS